MITSAGSTAGATAQVLPSVHPTAYAFLDWDQLTLPATEDCCSEFEHEKESDATKIASAPIESVSEIFHDPLNVGSLLHDPWICSDGVIYEKESLDYLVDTTCLPSTGRLFQSVRRQQDGSNHYVDVTKCVPAGLHMNEFSALREKKTKEEGGNLEQQQFSRWQAWKSRIASDKLDVSEWTSKSEKEWGDQLIETLKGGKKLHIRRNAGENEFGGDFEGKCWRMPTPDETTKFMLACKSGDFTYAVAKLEQLPRLIYARQSLTGGRDQVTFVHWILWHIATYGHPHSMTLATEHCEARRVATHSPSEFVTLLNSLLGNLDFAVGMRTCMRTEGWL